MKIRALIETVAVFSGTMFLIALVACSSPGAWVRQLTGRPLLEYGTMIVAPLLVLLVTRRPLASYGLSLKNISYQFDIVATTFVPVAIASATTALVNYRHWSGASILAGVHLVALFIVGALLRQKPTLYEDGRLAALLWMVPSTAQTLIAFTQVATAFFFYVGCVGFGEELLFRGYLQSRLNAAWGKPFRFYGVGWGWGLIISSALFGLMHALNFGSLAGGEWAPAWWWGVWTLVSGVVFGAVREKTGSILAPAMLHGLPQAIACALLGC